jgi:hypothetical protein
MVHRPIDVPKLAVDSAGYLARERALSGLVAEAHELPDGLADRGREHEGGNRWRGW